MNKEKLKEAIEKERESISITRFNYPDSYRSGEAHGEIKGLDKASRLIDQLDEPELTDQQAINKLAASLPLSVTEISHHLAQLMVHGSKVTYGKPYESEEIQEISKEYERLSKLENEIKGVSNLSLEEVAHKLATGELREKRYAVPVPYQKNSTLYYYKQDDGEISFKQGGMMYPDARFTWQEVEEQFPDIKHLAIEVTN